MDNRADGKKHERWGIDRVEALSLLYKFTRRGSHDGKYRVTAQTSAVQVQYRQYTRGTTKMLDEGETAHSCNLSAHPAHFCSEGIFQPFGRTRSGKKVGLTLVIEVALQKTLVSRTYSVMSRREP